MKVCYMKHEGQMIHVVPLNKRAFIKAQHKESKAGSNTRDSNTKGGEEHRRLQ